MSVVPYLKFMLVNTTVAPPTYTPANLKAGTPATCGGVEMDTPTHTALLALINDFKTRRNDLFKEFPDQFLIAQSELIDEIKTTGTIPAIDLNARQLRRTGIDFTGLLDELDNEEEFLDDEDEEDEEPYEEVKEKKAVTKPLKKKPATAAASTAASATANPTGTKEKKVPARRGRKKATPVDGDADATPHETKVEENVADE